MDLWFLNLFLDVLNSSLMEDHDFVFKKIELENKLEWLHKNILIASIWKYVFPLLAIIH